MSSRSGRASSRYIFNSVLTFKVLWITFYIFVSVYQKKSGILICCIESI